MFSKYLYFGILTVIFLLLQGATCFFVKHVKKGMCINITEIFQERQSWGNLSFVGLSNKCLDPTVQCRFLDNSAMFSLKTMTCFEGTTRLSGAAYDLPMLFLLRATDPRGNCRDNDHVVTQTSWGGLSIHYKGRYIEDTRCAVPKTNIYIYKAVGIDPYIGLEGCNEAENKRFNFGSVTCSGNAVKNANCPKDQYMVVKTASYRRLSPTKTCGLSNDYTCEVDVTCRLKKQCDGQPECIINVKDNLFFGDQCPGSTKYLYFEYQCDDTATSFKNHCSVQFPDKPTDLTITNIRSREAEISWKAPKNTGYGTLIGFKIKINKKTPKTVNAIKNNWKLQNLTPYTKYEVSVAARNKHGYGEEIITSFVTSEEAPEGPPLNVSVTAKSSSSLSVTWEPPEKDKRNGMIVNYIVCVSHRKYEPCFRQYTKKKKIINIPDLINSTRYYVRVLARTKVGRGPFSESREKFTNGKQPKISTNGTASTLTFFLQIPPRNFTHFYVVVLKLKDGKQGRSPASYRDNELVTYSEVEQSTDPKPYIAAILTSNDGNMFILGDGRNISIPTSRRHRSTSSSYYNGPLEPDTSYIIFQRIFINNKGDYYSTDWSPPSKTNKYPGRPRVLTDISSDEIKAKEGDLVNLLCSAQGEPPITFSWEKDKKSLKSLMEIEKPHRSSLLVVTVKDQTSFGNYICHIRDRLQSTNHTISVKKYTEDGGEPAEDDEKLKYLVGIIVFATLLVVSFAIIACLTYQNRQLKSSKTNVENNSENIINLNEIYTDTIQNHANCEEVENDQSTYTALNKTGEDKNDDLLYAHLNEGNQEDYEN